MSTEKTDALENTKDISTVVTEIPDGTETASANVPADEERQTQTFTGLEGTADFDVEEYIDDEVQEVTEEIPEDEGSGASEETGEAAGTAEAAEEGEDAGAGETAEESEDAGSGEAEETAEEPETEAAEETSEETSEEDGAEKKPETDPETEAIKQKIRERKREKKRKEQRRRTLFWTILTTIVLVIAGFAFSLSGFFVVDSIEVRGNSHFTAEEIINIGHAVPGHNIIYNPGSKTIVDYLVQNPYIKYASVTRKLPSTLVINVEERAEAICFNYDDDFLIMDDEGILLKKTRTEPKITNVKGFVVTKIKLGDTVGTENPRMFSKLLRLIRTMNSADMYFVSIDMTKYEEDMSVKAYIYDKLVVKTDYELLITSLKNGRLHRIVEKLFEDDVKRGTITITGEGEASFEPGI